MEQDLERNNAPSQADTPVPETRETPATGVETAKPGFLGELREVWRLFIRFRFKALLIDPTTNGLLQFCRYGLTAVLSTAMDFLGLYVFTDCLGRHYLIGTVIGYIAGIAVTYLASKLLVFRANEARVGTLAEIGGHLVIGLIALGLTELIMWLFTDVMGLHYMLSKVISTVIVFFWNYYGRKYILYK